MNRPNFLFISTHDINPHIGCYDGVWPGAEQAVTPRLDELAAQGVRFDTALAAAPVCAPSRSAIFTGAYPTAIGTMHMRTNAVPPDEVRLVPEILRRAGYYATNNWFTDVQFDVPPSAFDDCSDSAHWRDRPDADMPFFAAFHGLSTHESQLYAEGERLAAATAHVPAEARHDPAEVTLPPYHPDTPEFRTAWANYLDLITEMDHSVGVLLDQLDEDGLAENTVVIFWSDHGIGMPGAKRWAAEAGFRVPLIIRWPAAIAGGQVRTDVVETLDLAATVLAIADLPIPEYMDSTPLLTIAGESIASDGLAFGTRDRMTDEEDASRTVRDERYRYIRHLHPDRSPMQYGQYPDQFPPSRKLRALRYKEFTQISDGKEPDIMTARQRRLVATCKDPEELFDLIEDPHENHNLIDDPALAGVRDRLRDELDRWMIRTGDLGLIPELELLRRWNPDGRRAQTATPQVDFVDGMLTVNVETPAASIGFTRSEPGERPLSGMERGIGQRMQFAHPWSLYSAPIPSGEGPVWFQAWRLGFLPSEIIRFG